MKAWILSDGTVVHLGGKVEGSSVLAEHLRYDVEETRAGRPPGVDTLPPPGSERLNLDDPWHIDCWVRGEAERKNAAVTDAPEVTPNPEWDESADDPDLGDDPVH